MLPQTLIDKVAFYVVDIERAWRSGAAWEQSFQVCLDDLFRKHLSNKLRMDNEGDLLQGGDDKLNDGDKMDLGHWPKMREKAYPLKFPAKTGASTGFKMVSNTADMIVENKRYGWEDAEDCYYLKTTRYYIELKCESPDTHRFGGYDFHTAWKLDREKLIKTHAWEASQVPPTKRLRRRYWNIMIGLSPDAVSKMDSYIWTKTIKIPAENNTIFVGLDEITN